MIQATTESAWQRLLHLSTITPVDVFLVTYLRGETATDLVAYLEEYLPGLRREWALACIIYVRPMLENVLEFNEKTVEMLRDPLKRFATSDPDVARAMVCRRMHKAVNANSSAYLKYALAAFIDFGLGDYDSAIGNAECAYLNHRISDFGDAMDRTEYEDAISETILEAAEKSAAALAPLLTKKRIELTVAA